ncbi:hypothetical protein C8R45DRAFT_528685 [Mycena sanguinolenta]|nr:hypothetical protein C8R45DRAFT_528685 [Mycena sanguinolenta]
MQDTRVLALSLVTPIGSGAPPATSGCSGQRVAADLDTRAQGATSIISVFGQLTVCIVFLESLDGHDHAPAHCITSSRPPLAPDPHPAGFDFLPDMAYSVRTYRSQYYFSSLIFFFFFCRILVYHVNLLSIFTQGEHLHAYQSFTDIWSRMCQVCEGWINSSIFESGI